ncbi:MAG: WYL domain-containing protein [Fusobacteriaceae bacterium]|jgi:DNA-binding transcriptional ArsR family regulator|nr:WYL domain-containing protein [Fusobacteriaceae bacterium]
MGYSELIKNVSRIRSYMREFFVYGFKNRDEIGGKSPRSYDNEKRRIESWLGDFMTFRQDSSGKAVFLSVDSRRVPCNPLYKAWKAASFTKNDVSLHFILFDILADGKSRTLTDLIKTIDEEYLAFFDCPEPVDESTLRKKLQEYSDMGLLTTAKQGKQYLYSLSAGEVNLSSWQDAVMFFSESSPLGVVGSFILDKYDKLETELFSFKHRYFLFALDNGILLDLLTAIQTQRKVELEIAGDHSDLRGQALVVPLKIYVSTQGGRQYAAAYSIYRKKIVFYRLDSIVKVKALEVRPDYSALQRELKAVQPNIWGVSCGQSCLEHLEMTLSVAPEDAHIIRRLQREKRCGSVIRTAVNEWKFSADVYDPWELLPWLRTFIGRIRSLTCSDKKTERQFWSDYTAMTKLYGGDENAL